MQVDLYNLAPVLELMALGLLLAGWPLLWWWRKHGKATPALRLKALTLLILTLTFELVLVGAFTRLTDSGLGCPDWPGCYGQASPIGARHDIAQAQAAVPDGPVTHNKAWIEMVHRYMATTVGVLIIALTAWTWRMWWPVRKDAVARQRLVHPVWPSVTLIWVSVQGAFGALTVTMKLFPAIVTLHLLLAVGLLALLAVQAVRYEGWRSVPLPRCQRISLYLALVLLVTQIALGAWVSTNYAVLACRDFPTCQGQWWPPVDTSGFALWRELGHTADGQLLAFSALVTIHHVHRTMAWLVVALLLWVGWRLRVHPELKRWAHGLMALVGLQFISGLSNVVLGWPLLAALLHSGGASAVAVVLVWMLCLSRRSDDAQPSPVVRDSSKPIA